MTRRHKARRRGRKAPIPFEVEYEVDVVKPVELKGRDRTSGEPVITMSTTTVVETRVETFTCTGELSMLAMSEMAGYFDVSVDDIDPAALAMFREIIASAIGDPAEYQRFLKFSLAHLDNEDIMDILGDLVEAFTNRPFGLPSDSLPPPSSSGDDSKVITLPGGYRVASGD